VIAKEEVPQAKDSRECAWSFVSKHSTSSTIPNFAGPDTDFGGGSFGTVTFLSNPMREVQLGLKLYF